MEKVRVSDLTKIRTGKLDANASSEDGKYPFFTCSKEPLRISTYTYDCECVLVAGNGDLNVKYYNGKFDAYQRTYIIEDNTIKYIDYDLDLRIFPSGEYKILDKLEYNYHKRIMKYSDDLDLIINKSLEELIEYYKKHFFPFLKDKNVEYYNQYLNLKKCKNQ